MNTHPILPQHIDATQRSCFISCKQKFYDEFVLGLRHPELSIHLHAGACLAEAIELMGRLVHQHQLPYNEALLKVHAYFLKVWGEIEAPERGSGSTKSKDRVWAAVEDYFQTYPPLTDHIQPHFISGEPSYEFTFAIPLIDGFPLHPSGDPFFYSGRFDRLGDWYGTTVIQDEKTTTSIGGDWAEKWDLRGQFLGYVWACQHHGINTETVAIRGIGILKTKIHQVEAMKTYAKWEIERWYEQLRRDVTEIRRAWDEGYWDYNFGETCTSYFGCPYSKICKSPKPENWYNTYRVNRWNPLAKNPTQSPALEAERIAANA